MATLPYSAVKKLLPAIAVQEWSCKCHPCSIEITTLSGRYSAINSDESSGRNFAAYQKVAQALNGTAAAAAAPSATPAGSSASSVRIGGISISLVFAALIGLL